MICARAIRSCSTRWPISFKSLDAISVVDLACGAGSTVRALGPHLPARQHWDLVDNDHRLLTVACSGKFTGDIRLNAVPLDLSSNFEAALDGTKDLITISALLDLVSEDWLDRFTRHVAAHALRVYAALTYDGRIELSPADPLDAAITSAVNAHQRTDKGFGPALGPSAAAAAISKFKALGYSIVHGNSDWTIGTADQEIQHELLAGWAAAASEIKSLPRADIDNWLAQAKNRGQRTRFNNARGSCRLLCHAKRHALSRQVAIEQHIVFDLVQPHRHALGLIGPIERRQLDPGTSGAQHDGRDGYMQPIETSRRDKPRHGISTALDQHSPHPYSVSAATIADGAIFPSSAGRVMTLDAGRRRGLRSFCGDQQTANPVLGKQPCLGSEAPPRIDDGTHGLRTRDMPDRQLRVIGQRRSNADHDNIDQRAQPVQMFDAGRTVDVLGVTGRRRDPTVERLADLPDNHQIVHHPVPQRAEQIRPGLRQMLLSCTKKLDKALPRIGRSKFAGGEIAELHGEIRFSLVINATIGHSIPKIHLISGGMISGLSVFHERAQ